MTLLLTRGDVERALDLERCIAAIEDAFRQRALGRPMPGGLLGVHADAGTFHVKAACSADASYFAAKINANFPANPARHALPTIQGVLTLFEATCGTPVAVMDSMSVTTLRTAAATAVAARYLASPDASTLAIVGCGVQARAHLAALRVVRPVTRVFAYDADPSAAKRFADEMTSLHRLPVDVVARVEDGTARSDLIVTCTTAERAFLSPAHVRAGAFIGAVGADNPHKQEIAPELLAAAAVVVDDRGQCAAIGDLHHAIRDGLMTAADVRAELGEVVLNPARGRRDADEIVVFDSTGVAIEDVAAAAAIYERARQDRIGLVVDLSA